MTIILYILQNAYKSQRYQFKNDEEWHRELLASYSGKRLSEMIPENVDFRVVNASPEIGDSADSVFSPDKKHLKNMIKKHSPDIVCACGKIAQKGCYDLGIEFVPLPHPAWRQLSKDITNRIQENLSEMAGVL